MTPILVTGAAGFIGFHLTQRLLARGEEVVGVDNLNPYYDVSLKHARLAELQKRRGFTFARCDLEDIEKIRELFDANHFLSVVNLAAQAGVRYSLDHPRAYIRSNIDGFLNILEGCRQFPVRHLVFASSSSVYGSNTKMPFSVHDNVDHPISLYAATKKANELMAHTYSHLFRIPTTGLRFFTVYGPWGRPDMALFIFARAILGGESITLFNHGHMRRDFTFIDDIVEGVVRVLDTPATPNADWSSARPDPASSTAPYRLYNIGNNNPVELTYLVDLLEQNLGKKATRVLADMQPGDVPATHADVTALESAVGFTPRTSIEEGVRRFVDWYRAYYR